MGHRNWGSHENTGRPLGQRPPLERPAKLLGRDPLPKKPGLKGVKTDDKRKYGVPRIAGTITTAVLVGDAKHPIRAGTTVVQGGSFGSYLAIPDPGPVVIKYRWEGQDFVKKASVADQTLEVTLPGGKDENGKTR
jgi:hypothetical protein